MEITLKYKEINDRHLVVISCKNANVIKMLQIMVLIERIIMLDTYFITLEFNKINEAKKFADEIYDILQKSGNFIVTK